MGTLLDTHDNCRDALIEIEVFYVFFLFLTNLISGIYLNM